MINTSLGSQTRFGLPPRTSISIGPGLVAISSTVPANPANSAKKSFHGQWKYVIAALTSLIIFVLCFMRFAPLFSLFGGRPLG